MPTTIPTLTHPPTPPQPDQTRPAFAAASYAFVAWWAGTHAGELDDWADAINAAFVEIATSEANALASENAAATSAATADSRATSATLAQQDAATSRNQAATSATAASASATAASASATAASASATAAAAFAKSGGYLRNEPFTGGAPSKVTLYVPQYLSVLIGATALSGSGLSDLLLTDASVWDSTATNYAVAANRAGKDFYVYACVNHVGALVMKLSANATTPYGFTTADSRLVGGFHCLCADVGTISGHPLSGYVAGDILPASVWDIQHRPVSAPQGMVYAAGIGKWVDIYLASVSAGALVSINGGTIADGASSPAFDWLDFSEWLGRVGKRLPTQAEFMALSNGANQGTAIAGSADPGTTGGHTDTAGQRMVSNIGCEDVCGVLWQWGQDAGGPYATATWKDQYASARTNQRGSGYNVANRVMMGGFYNAGAYCGSRCTNWYNAPEALDATFSARGLSDPLTDGA